MIPFLVIYQRLSSTKTMEEMSKEGELGVKKIGHPVKERKEGKTQVQSSFRIIAHHWAWRPSNTN